MRSFVVATFFASVLGSACSSSEQDSPIPPGTYSLTDAEETVMVIDEQGYFSWTVRTCGDWLRSGSGSLEREPDGSIRIYACSTYPGGGAAFWAPAIPATKLRARVLDDGFAVDVEAKDARPFTQIWKRGDACRSTCGCELPARATGC